MPERAYSIPIVKRPGLRKQRPLRLRIIAGVVLLAFVTLALHGNGLLALIFVGGGLGGWRLAEEIRRRRKRDAVLQEIEGLSAPVFLQYVADLLRAQGYGVLRIAHSDDNYGDLLLGYGDKSLAVRVLHARGRLGKGELARTLGRMKLYGSQGAMIVTNRSISWAAWRYAQRVRCVMIDGNELVRLIGQYRQGHRVYTFQREEAVKLRGRK